MNCLVSCLPLIAGLVTATASLAYEPPVGLSHPRVLVSGQTVTVLSTRNESTHSPMLEVQELMAEGRLSAGRSVRLPEMLHQWMVSTTTNINFVPEIPPSFVATHTNGHCYALPALAYEAESNSGVEALTCYDLGKNSLNMKLGGHIVLATPMKITKSKIFITTQAYAFDVRDMFFFENYLFVLIQEQKEQLDASAPVVLHYGKLGAKTPFQRLLLFDLPKISPSIYPAISNVASCGSVMMVAWFQNAGQDSDSLMGMQWRVSVDSAGKIGIEKDDIMKLVSLSHWNSTAHLASRADEFVLVFADVAGPREGYGISNGIVALTLPVEKE